MNEKKSECCQEKCAGIVRGSTLEAGCIDPACPCHQPPEQSREPNCKTSPHCSHNTNRRDLSKPCSIEVKTPTYENNFFDVREGESDRSGLDWNNKPVTIDEIEKAVEANGGKFYYGEVGEEQSGDTVEDLEKTIRMLAWKATELDIDLLVGIVRHEIAKACAEERERLEEEHNKCASELTNMADEMFAKGKIAGAAETNKQFNAQLSEVISILKSAKDGFEANNRELKAIRGLRTPNHEGK